MQDKHGGGGQKRNIRHRRAYSDEVDVFQREIHKVRAAEELARLNKPMSGDGAPRSSQEEELGRLSKSAGRAGLDVEEHPRTASGENPGAGARQSSQPPGAVGPYFSTEASTSRGWGSANAKVNSRTVSRSAALPWAHRGTYWSSCRAAAVLHLMSTRITG